MRRFKDGEKEGQGRHKTESYFGDSERDEWMGNKIFACCWLDEKMVKGTESVSEAVDWHFWYFIVFLSVTKAPQNQAKPLFFGNHNDHTNNGAFVKLWGDDGDCA